MQTFVPYADARRCAAVLDDRRLGKQRVEVLQLMRALTVPGHGWRHHPAAKMWRGHEEALAAYGRAICEEWVGRGHADTCATKILDDARTAGVTTVRSPEDLEASGDMPPWWGDEDVHRSHRSNLLRKDPEHYGRFFDDVPDDLPYVWPVPAEG